MDTYFPLDTPLLVPVMLYLVSMGYPLATSVQYTGTDGPGISILPGTMIWYLDTDIHIDIELVTINRNMNSEPDTEYHILP